MSLILIDDLIVVSTSQVTIGGAADVFADKSHGTATQEELGTTGMQAAESNYPGIKGIDSHSATTRSDNRRAVQQAPITINRSDLLC
jgi:hypothetical protein